MLKLDPDRPRTTGPELKAALRALGVSHKKFARDTDTTNINVLRWLRETSNPRDMPPRWVDWVLLAYHLFPEIRIKEESVPLPMHDWGMPDDKDEIYGQDLPGILTFYGITPEKFASHAGINVWGVKNRYQLPKFVNEPLPTWMDWIFYMYEMVPETKESGLGFALPFDEWRGHGTKDS